MCACESKIENKERVKLNDTRKYVSECVKKKEYSLRIQRTKCSETLAQREFPNQNVLPP